MADNDWWLIGTVKIPENKKDELNGYVLQLLDRCGIRKTKEITLGEKKVTVIKKVAPDENGIVHFDYSIFEKIHRKVCTYDMNTCKLNTPATGGNEFALAVNFIMTLQESYTNGACYMMHKDKLVKYVTVYLKIIYSILGKKFYLDNRGRLWEMLLFFRNHEKSVKVSEEDILCGISWDYTHMDLAQGRVLLDLTNSEVSPCENQDKITTRDEIENAGYGARRVYLFDLLTRLQNTDDKSLNSYLMELLEADLVKRKQLAERDDDYGALAQLSLYMLPASIISIYAIAKKSDFWETWDSFHINGYTDTLIRLRDDVEDTCEPDNEYPFYKAIERDSEDEFLEFWDGSNLNISARLKECIEDWKFRLPQMEDIATGAVESYLAEIIIDLKDDWNCRYVDEEFVDEILSHKEDIQFRKALVLFRDLTEEDIKYFPELTRRQAIDWVIKNNRHDCTAMMAYESLFINTEQRKQIFGF